MGNPQALMSPRLVFLVVLLASGCARQPAQCALPTEQMPAAPHAQQPRRLVAALTPGGACHVKLQLPQTSSNDAWLAARDAALTTAQSAALACCADPQLRQPSAWLAGQTSFDVEFSCPPP
jgi:hypothetical protein